MKVIGITALLVVAGAANAQLINGDFEQGTVQNPFPGWQSTGTASLMGGGNPGQMVCFSAGGGSLTQTFNCEDPLQHGDSCRLTFDYRAAPGTTFNVKFTGTGASSNFGNNSVGALLDNNWHTRTLVAPCGIVTIEITGNGNAATGGKVCFDNFSAVCVPEPASMAALGCGALALLRRRRGNCK